METLYTRVEAARALRVSVDTFDVAGDLVIVDRDGKPVRAREASLSWSLPEAGIERSRAAMELPAPGVAIATGLIMPRGGRWRLQLELLIDDFTKLTFVGGIDVP